MQLTDTQIETVENKTDLMAIKKDNTAHEKLEEAFGEHTFFMNDDGLFVFMRTEQTDTTAHLLAFAMWDEDDKSKLLQLAEPANAGIALDLEKVEIQDYRESPTVH